MPTDSSPVALRHAVHDLSLWLPEALEMNTCRVLVCLSMAAFAWSSTVRAQPLPTPTTNADDSDVLGARAYSCVDPADVLGRRKIQDEPCRWPLYHLPAAAAPAPGEQALSTRYASKPTAAQAGHAMFWRFPVQPRGPFDAPRHTWR